MPGTLLGGDGLPERVGLSQTDEDRKPAQARPAFRKPGACTALALLAPCGRGFVEAVVAPEEFVADRDGGDACDPCRYVWWVGLFTKLLLGNGTLKPKLRAALESEGVVLVEEGLPGTITYAHFKAPGRRHHGKVVGECLGLGISEQRLALYCRSGRVKLIDQPFTEPRLSALDVSLERDDRVALRIDYDRVAVPKVSGQMTIRAVTPNAARVVEQLSSRLGPQG